MTDRLEAIREQIVEDPVKGAKELSNYLASFPRWPTEHDWSKMRSEVDLKRNELKQIAEEIYLFNSVTKLEEWKRVVFFLFEICGALSKTYASNELSKVVLHTEKSFPLVQLQQSAARTSNDKFLVFISTKVIELRDVQDIVGNSLNDIGIEVFIQYNTSFQAFRNDNVEPSPKVIEDCDIYIGFFWKKYNQVAVQEYLYARSMQKPCFVYVREKNCQREENLENFLKTEFHTLPPNVSLDFFDSALALGRRVTNDITTWLKRRYREMTAQIQEAHNSQEELAHLQFEVRRLQAASRNPLPQGTAVDYLVQQLRPWFEALEYKFGDHHIRSDNYFEWIIHVPRRGKRYDRILVRGIEGDAEVSHIDALRLSVNEKEANEGWLVVARKKSQDVLKTLALRENTDLLCYTLDELLEEAANFSRYFDWLEVEVKRRGIDRKYAPRICIKEEFDPITKQKIGETIYDERKGWLDGYIDRWLEDPTARHISLLGDLNDDRTEFVLHYAWSALQVYRKTVDEERERSRLPLVVPLGDFARRDSIDIKSLLSEFFFSKHNITLPGHYLAFEQLNQMGKLLLIFDGFERIADQLDSRKSINSFWELARVVVPGAKVVLTCHTGCFPASLEDRTLLNPELQEATALLTGKSPQFEKLRLSR